MTPQGICKNYGVCYRADDKKPMSLDRTSGICPECGKELTEIPPSPWIKRWILIVLIVVVGGGWYFYQNNGQEPDKLIAVEDDSLFDYYSPPVEYDSQQSCRDAISENIAKIQSQIDAIQTQIASTPVPSLKTVQKKIKDIHTQINQCPESSSTVEKLHQGIEEIYSQLIDKIQKQLETIEEQTSTESPRSSLVPLERLREQVEAIQEAISGTIGGPVITALQRRLNELQEKIGRLMVILSVNREMPQCLSSASAEMQNKLRMFFVPPVQKRRVPKYLHVWMKPIANSKINQSEFFIMRREVKVGEFRDYVNTLNRRQKEKLGTAWRQEGLEDLPDDNPVASVPWWAANGYARWLARKTGCPLALPTYNQWAAAAISYASPKLAVIEDTHFDSGPMRRNNEGSSGGLDLLLMGSSEKLPSVLDLLGNLREWSKDECNGGHYLLGADYKTSRANILGEKVCEAYTLDTIGFRLVLQAAR